MKFYYTCIIKLLPVTLYLLIHDKRINNKICHKKTGLSDKIINII